MRADSLISYPNPLLSTFWTNQKKNHTFVFNVEIITQYVLKIWFFTKIDSDCSPDGTDYMDANGKCHCYQGFSGDLCDDFCPEGEYGIPPNCHGNILFQPFTS